MEKTLITAITFISLTAFAQPNFEWVKSMGSTGPDQGNSITTNVSGNVYTTGQFSGTVDFDPELDRPVMHRMEALMVFLNKFGDIFPKKITGSTIVVKVT